MIRNLGKRPGDEEPKLEMFEVTDPQELAEAREQRAQADLNWAWWKEHMAEVVVPANRGKFVCIAGQEAFVGDTVQQAVALATAAHPDDRGRITRYIPKESKKMWKIYTTVSRGRTVTPHVVLNRSASRHFAEQL